MTNSKFIKSITFIYLLITDSYTVKLLSKFNKYMMHSVKCSLTYRTIVKDYRMFDIWRTSITGKAIHSIISAFWGAKNKCLDYINDSTETSFFYSIFCAPYEFCNKTRLRGYSFILIAVLFMLLEIHLILLLVGFAYILYVSLFKTIKGIYIFAFLLPLLNLTQIIFFAFIIFISFIAKEKETKTVKLEPFFILFFVFLVLAVLISPFKVSSMRTLTLYISGMIFAYTLVNLLNTDKRLINFMKVNVSAGLFQSLYAILQYRLRISMGGTWVDVEAFGEVTTRAMGTLGNPNVLAKYLVLVGVMAVIIVLTEKKIWERLFYGFCGAMIFTGLMLSLSRGGWLAFLFAITIFFVLIDKRLLIAIGTMGALSIVMLPDIVMRRFASIVNLADSSNAYRISIWIGTLDLVKYHWLRGVGLGLEAFSYQYQFFVFGSALAVHSHNLFLQLASEIGALGLVTFFVLLLALWKWVILSIPRMPRRKNVIITYGLLAAMAGHILHGTVEHVWFDPRILFFFWLIIGLIISSVEIGAETND
ncbi:MAG: O-antigen ligase family protein [Clostridiales bacterium]|nr:O-antigen ligase family protein [Clostridiales bacterium]